MNPAQLAFTVKSRTVRRPLGTYLDELVHNERLPLHDLNALTDRRAASIASFAATQSPYYERRFREAGISLARIEDVDEWTRIPLSGRGDFKAHEFDILSTEANDRTARLGKTGGSTGEPLRTRHDNRAATLALAWRMYGWWGVQPWDNLARVGRWGFGIKDSLKNAVTWWPSKQVYLDATLFDADSMRAFHRRLVRTRPALIEGYVGAMLEFADFLEAEGLRIPKPRAIATTAAVLNDNARRRLENVYETEIFDEYRGSEVNWLAGECRAHAGLHMNSDARLIEVVDPDGRRVEPGEIGDIAITDFTNRVFPIIRYRPGDRARLLAAPCDCGVTLPLMDYPEGRTTDMVRLPSGKAINHGLMAMFADHPEAVRVFQIHQHADYSLNISIVRGDDPAADAHVDEAVKKVRRRINDEVAVRVAYVDSLQYTNGKLKYLISDVPAPGEPKEGVAQPPAPQD